MFRSWNHKKANHKKANNRCTSKWLLLQEGLIKIIHFIKWLYSFHLLSERQQTESGQAMKLSYLFILTVYSLPSLSLPELFSLFHATLGQSPLTQSFQILEQFCIYLCCRQKLTLNSCFQWFQYRLQSHQSVSVTFNPTGTIATA